MLNSSKEFNIIVTTIVFRHIMTLLGDDNSYHYLIVDYFLEKIYQKFECLNYLNFTLS